MEFIIRECRVEDASAIQRLNASEMGYDYPIEQTRQQMMDLLRSEKDKFFVAEVDGIVVGYVHANDYALLYAPKMKNIMGIAVSAGCQRMGIGRALLERVEQWCAETGAEGVRLVSGASRLDAHRFYRSMGYGEGRPQINFKKRIRYARYLILL